MYDRDLPVVAFQAPDVVQQLQRASWIVDPDDHIDRTVNCLGHDGLARFKKTRAQDGWNDDSEIEHEPLSKYQAMPSLTYSSTITPG